MNYITLRNERNRRLTAAVRMKMSQQRLQRVTDELLGDVLNSPVERGFFVSVDHIIVMERRRREGTLPPMSDNNRRMWGEIFDEFDRFLTARPGETRTNAAIHVASQGRASRFYITRKNAVRILRENNLMP